MTYFIAIHVSDLTGF